MNPAARLILSAARRDGTESPLVGEPVPGYSHQVSNPHTISAPCGLSRRTKRKREKRREVRRQSLTPSGTGPRLSSRSSSLKHAVSTGSTSEARPLSPVGGRYSGRACCMKEWNACPPLWPSHTFLRRAVLIDLHTMGSCATGQRAEGEMWGVELKRCGASRTPQHSTLENALPPKGPRGTAVKSLGLGR